MMSQAGQSDRELQDALITYLADAKVRHSSSSSLPLSPEQARRAGKFARFLARRYYRDRLARSFRTSRLFGSGAEALVEAADFDAFLDDCALGSLASAEPVGALAVEYLSRGPAPGPWWSDLLQYERLFFLQAASTENAMAGECPQPGPSARCHTFSWLLPELRRRLHAGEAVGGELRRQVTLLFSRTREGRIYVVEPDQAAAAVFQAADGRRSREQISAATSLSAAAVRQAIAALVQVGACVSS